MRLATYNLLHGMSVKSEHAGKVIAAELTEAVRSLETDILGLQEVDVGQPRSGSVDQVRLAAEAMGAEHWRFVPTVVGTPGPGGSFRPVTGADVRHSLHGDLEGPHYGVGMVSRWPVHEWRQLILQPAKMSLPLLVAGGPRARVLRVPDEPRAALAAIIEVDGVRITVATAHLSFVPGVNVHQLRRIRGWLQDMPRPLVLLGDFNLPGRIPSLVTGLSATVQEPTYPVFKPTVQFDHVLVDGLTALDWQTLALPVSDHCAVTVDVQDPLDRPDVR